MLDQLPSHLAMVVLQGCGASLSKCLSVLPDTLHPLVLGVHCPALSMHSCMHLGKRSFPNASSSRMATALQPLFKAAESFPGLREINISVPYSGSQLVTNDGVAQSFEDALCKLTELNTVVVRPGFLTYAIPMVLSRALPNLSHLRTLTVARDLTWRSLGCRELHVALTACSRLRHLHFSRIDCDWRDEGDAPSQLALSLVRMTLLRSLTLTCGSVNVNVLKDVRTLLPSSQAAWLPMLRDLNLSSNFACWDSAKFAEDFAPVLSRLPNLQRVDVSDNNISPGALSPLIAQTVCCVHVIASLAQGTFPACSAVLLQHSCFL